VEVTQAMVKMILDLTRPVAAEEEMVGIFSRGARGHVDEADILWRNMRPLVGRRWRRASQQKILHFRGAVLLQTVAT
jgi:hypothetical protein